MNVSLRKTLITTYLSMTSTMTAEEIYVYLTRVSDMYKKLTLRYYNEFETIIEVDIKMFNIKFSMKFETKYICKELINAQYREMLYGCIDKWLSLKPFESGDSNE